MFMVARCTGNTLFTLGSALIIPLIHLVTPNSPDFLISKQWVNTPTRVSPVRACRAEGTALGERFEQRLY